MTIQPIYHGIGGLIGLPAAHSNVQICRSKSSASIDPSQLPLKAAVQSLLAALPRGLGPITLKHRGMSRQARAAGGERFLSLAKTIGERMLPQHVRDRAAESFV